MSVAAILALVIELEPAELALLELGIAELKAARAGGETEASAVARARATMNAAVDLEEDLESPKPKGT